MSSSVRGCLGPVQHPIRVFLDFLGVTFWAWAGPMLWAVPGASPGARAGAVLLATTQISLFSVSALYHGVPWTPRWKKRWQRVDHSMIYLKIAGGVTAMAWLTRTHEAYPWLVPALWLVAVLGVAQKAFMPWVPEKASIPVQIAQGCLGIPVLGQLSAVAPPELSACALSGAIFYTVGVCVFVTERPTLWPRWFSFHELFHLLLLFASGSLYLLMAGSAAAGAGS